MEAKISSIFLILLAIPAGYSQQRIDYGESPWGRIDVVWTELSSEKCNLDTKVRKNHFKACPPVAGYQLLYGGNEASPKIIIVAPNRKRHVIHYWDLAAGNFISLKKEISWQVARRRTGKVTPQALILQANIKQDEFTRFRGPYTIIAKLTPTEVCVVGRVPTSPYSAADLAGFRYSPQLGKCVGLDNVGRKDFLGVVFGFTGKGRYEDAKSAVKQIASPATRSVGYKEIALAQAESGDKAAARTTLLLGLDEVLKQKEVSTFPHPYGGKEIETSKDHNLLVILSAMVVVGLDTEVNDNLKFVRNSEFPEALLWIARAQGSSPSVGGRGDREAAKATFLKAVQIEMKRTDTAMADSNLFHILEAQLEIGLVDEARQTVLFIKNPETRKAGEYAIVSSTVKPPG